MRRTNRWLLPSLLLGVYLFLKLQGWIYARSAADLERQLDELRPALAVKALSEQLQKARPAYVEAVEKIQQMDLKGAEFLKQLSQDLPVSITLRHVQIRPDRGLSIDGVVLPSMRDPEGVVAGWAQTLRPVWPKIRVWNLRPSVGAPEKWEFHLEGAG